MLFSLLGYRVIDESTCTHQWSKSYLLVQFQGNVTEEISTTLAILNEKLRTYLLPFDASLSNEDPSAIERECPSNICIRAVSSRDVKKVCYYIKCILLLYWF